MSSQELVLDFATAS